MRIAMFFVFMACRVLDKKSLEGFALLVTLEDWLEYVRLQAKGVTQKGEKGQKK